MKTYDLPPLSSLRAFEAAARRASFKAAAAELFVTPTAISHQLRQLEAALGVRLLNRSPRSVTLTPEGLELYTAVAAGFRELSEVTRRLKKRPVPVLTLSATPAFIGHWLMPRLEALRRLLPADRLRLHASNDVMDLRAGESDIAIRYDTKPAENLVTTPLREDRFAPICSPRLAITKPTHLRRAGLIHVDGRRTPRPVPDWARWCDRARLKGLDTEAGLRFTDSMHAVQAAVAGQGVALASLVLVADALRAGILVQPFEPTLAGATYYFVCAPEVSARDDVAALRDWFVEELQ
jgi:LysR family glycine cleavage system transcriptional activator